MQINTYHSLDEYSMPENWCGEGVEVRDNELLLVYNPQYKLTIVLSGAALIMAVRDFKKMLTVISWTLKDDDYYLCALHVLRVYISQHEPDQKRRTSLIKAIKAAARRRGVEMEGDIL